MSDFLSTAVSEARLDEEARSMETPIEVLRPMALGRSPHRSLLEAIGKGTGEVRLLAEVKRASPSRGTIRADLDVAATARAYEKGGASAISVLTEPRRFGGSLEDLARAREAAGLPILRKDFVVTAYGVYEAAARGADAVLLIAAAAPLHELEECISASIETGLDVLFEVIDEEDVRKALHLEPPIVGVNARDLRTLAMDPDRHARLRDRLPASSAAVAESGIRTFEDLERVRALGYDAALVGEVLSGARDPEAAVRALLRAKGGRR